MLISALGTFATLLVELLLLFLVISYVAVSYTHLTLPTIYSV